MGRPHAMHLIWAVANPIEPDRWSSDRTEMIKRLMPHLRQFVRIRQALIGAEALSASVAALLDNMMIGAVCLNWLGMIVQANSRAKAILENGDGLISRDGFLRTHMAADDAQLTRLVAHALPRSGAPCVGGSMDARAVGHPDAARAARSSGGRSRRGHRRCRRAGPGRRSRCTSEHRSRARRRDARLDASGKPDSGGVG